MIRRCLKRLNPPPSITRSTIVGASVFSDNYGTERPIDDYQLSQLYYAPPMIKIRRPHLKNAKAHNAKVKRGLYIQADASRAAVGLPQRRVVAETMVKKKKM